MSLGWPPDTAEDTHEEQAESAEGAAGGGVSRMRTGHVAALVAHHVRSPEKDVE